MFRTTLIQKDQLKQPNNLRLGRYKYKHRTDIIYYHHLNQSTHDLNKNVWLRRRQIRNFRKIAPRFARQRPNGFAPGNLVMNRLFRDWHDTTNDAQRYYKVPVHYTDQLMADQI